MNSLIRVAVIGSGPAGFYAVQHLLATAGADCRIDMFDRLPTPFGLVRYGVAPDHAKIKTVIAVYHKLALHPAFRFFGGVEYGRDLRLADVARHYDAAVFATGAPSDRHLGVPGEELGGSHSATDFVAWYNGHPDYANHRFDLGVERAVVVGVGNVAVNVARILARDPAELASTDIADHALEVLRHSRVREVWLVGRRGPAQAAFTPPEVKELGELAGTETSTRPEEVELDPASRESLGSAPDKAALRKIEILKALAGRSQPERERRLQIRFWLSPVELRGEGGRLRAVRFVRNRPERGADGSVRAKATNVFEEIEAGLCFRSVGYRGLPLADLPFDEKSGIVPNVEGRVKPGIYVTGWIKRGPSGVIGTNKPDAQETIERLLEDHRAGALTPAAVEDREALPRELRERGVRWVDYQDWLRLDAQEIARGATQGRPRVKFTTREELSAALATSRS